MASNDFLPSKIRQLVEGNPWVSAIGANHLGANPGTGSFSYDSQESPLKSTQQLNVDWSRFENHTFFMSAEVKVNQAFDQIINRYPFDGTQREVEEFLDSLTGFEKWVFDNFPKYRGALSFSGSYISVQDTAGSIFPSISRKNNASSVIPKSPCVELQLFLPSQANDNMIVYQKKSNNNVGFSLVLSSSTSTSLAECKFLVTSGSLILSSSATLKKGEYNHVCTAIDTSTNFTVASIYLDGNLASSSDPNILGDIDTSGYNLLIGSGSTISLGSSPSFVPKTTLSGTIDEFRVFSSPRNPTLQKKYAKRSIFSDKTLDADGDLRLYFKFNEPPPPLTPDNSNINSIVLDSSGNSLHSFITGFDASLRISAVSDALNPITLEKNALSPVLFPGYADVITFNQQLLYSASLYDQANPNLITRLVPPHYLLEGSHQDGFGKNIDGNAVDEYGGTGGPGSGKLGSQQILLSFLYLWSKQFDELKLFVDQFSNLNYVDYETGDTVPDNFLLSLLKREGLNLPNLFANSTIEQYVSGDDTERDYSTIDNSLNSIKNALMRRTLVSMPKIISSKGTLHSVKSFLRTIGIDPDNTVRLREYGGPNNVPLGFSREKKHDVGVMLTVSGSSFVTSSFLSASRAEPGFPNLAGTFVNGISNNPSDGLLTSGSWTIEGLFAFVPSDNKDSKSLIRLQTTGSSTYPYCLANVIATPSQNLLSSSYLTLHAKVSESTTQQLELRLNLEDKGIFDGNKWYVSFGRFRNDEIDSVISSSYFLRVGRADSDGVIKLLQTSSYFLESSSPTTNRLQELDVSYNVSGSYVAIGSDSIANSSFLTSSATLTNFDGMVSSVRFWSRGLEDAEWKEHVSNYRSTGVELPQVNYNYVNSISGSFGKLRMDVIQKQDYYSLSGSSGELSFNDYSQNQIGMLGKNFLPGTDSFKATIFDSSNLSPYYDESSTSEKVRVRGLSTTDPMLLQPWTSAGPVYSITTPETPTDDSRFSVDFSLVDSLNKDIVNIFSSYEVLNNALGDANLNFGESYPGLDSIKDVYFNRLSGPIDFKTFFEFYKWFDTSIGTFIDQLLPKKTNFKGVNYVIEPHILERSKVAYQYAENYTLYRKSSVGSARGVDWLIENPIKKY